MGNCSPYEMEGNHCFEQGGKSDTWLHVLSVSALFQAGQRSDDLRSFFRN